MKKISNKYKCPKGFWDKFNDAQKQMFNLIYEQMGDQDIFMHPKGIKNKREHWSTTRFNTACISAWALENITVKLA
jgi:hypothetical protein